MIDSIVTVDDNRQCVHTTKCVIFKKVGISRFPHIRLIFFTRNASLGQSCQWMVMESDERLKFQV